MSKIKIIAKIKKLMIHERSARLIGNDAEADRFAETIAALREKHSVTQEILLDADDEASAYSDAGGEPLFQPSDPMFRRQRVLWEEVIAGSVSGFFDCRMIVLKRSNIKIVIGEKEIREKVKRSFRHLYDEAQRTAAAYLETCDGNAAENRLARQSFLHGFAEAVRQRFAYCRAERDETEKLSAATGLEPEWVKALEGQTAALARTEKLAVRENRREMIKEVENLKPTPLPKITKIDETAFFAGMNAGGSCPVSDEIALMAQEIRDDFRDVKHQVENQRRTLFWEDSFVARGNFYYGSAGGTTSASFAGRQMAFVFDDTDEI